MAHLPHLRRRSWRDTGMTLEQKMEVRALVPTSGSGPGASFLEVIYPGRLRRVDHELYSGPRCTRLLRRSVSY